MVNVRVWEVAARTVSSVAEDQQSHAESTASVT
jgi:hypothetical protein